MDISNVIRLIVEYNCRELRISEPNIRFVEADAFVTPTTKAATSRNGDGLIINYDFIESNPDAPMLWLILSHELRHIWQSKQVQYFDNYKTSAELSIEKYNEQKAEIEAWAWAIIVVDEKFGIHPTLEKQFGNEFMQKVYDRVFEIIK